MATSLNPSNERSATQRLSQFVKNLSMDEVRILSRMVNDWQKRDQRRHPRTPCSIITEYMVENQIHKDLMKNISLGGAFIEGPRTLPGGLVVSQSFFFSHFEIPIRSNSKIVWTSKEGFGVEFEILNTDR